ncbi:hypothetical protein THAOC_03153, partial [Thalassiosira oceanica]
VQDVRNLQVIPSIKSEFVHRYTPIRDGSDAICTVRNGKAFFAALINHHATSADKQLQSGKLNSTTITGAHFGDHLSGGPVQLLQTGAGEALGHEFDYVVAVTTRQPAVCPASPSDCHIPVGERAA